MTVAGVPSPSTQVQSRQPRWVKVLDQTKCIGCHACTTACKSENEVPVGVTRTFVKSVDVGTFPHVRRNFQVTRCNQCTDAPCVSICPTGAMFQRGDGIVDFDKSSCIGCKACMAACPYDAIFINPDDHSAEKCNFCAHRLEVGLEPACVVVCPTGAILVGDRNDPASAVARITQRQPVAVRRPEKGTRPGVFYTGAHHSTLDPLAASRPTGGLLAWATLGAHWAAGPWSRLRAMLSSAVEPGHPVSHNSSAAAVVSYDVPHRAPWGWRVSLYTWTKGIAAGAFLAPLLAVLDGRLRWSSTTFSWVAPLVALAFLALTGFLLVADLKHPERFYMLFTRGRHQSWLVRGGIILAAYGAALVADLGASAAGSTAAHQVVAGFAAPLAVATAVYTAFLFAQAKARDMWQSPLLGPQLFVQAVMLGAAAILPAAIGLHEHQAVPVLELALATAAGAHLLMMAAEVTLGHPTAHAQVALHELALGRFAPAVWTGAILAATASAAPWIGVAATPVALIGLMVHEHAAVQAAQSVPLA